MPEIDWDAVDAMPFEEARAFLVALLPPPGERREFLWHPRFRAWISRHTAELTNLMPEFDWRSRFQDDMRRIKPKENVNAS